MFGTGFIVICVFGAFGIGWLFGCVSMLGIMEMVKEEKNDEESIKYEDLK